MQDCKLYSPAFLHTKALMNLRDIKTKQKMQAIKTKDTKGNIQHFIKKQSIRTRNADKDTRQESISSKANVQATNSISKKASLRLIPCSSCSYLYTENPPPANFRAHFSIYQDTCPNMEQFQHKKKGYTISCVQTYIYPSLKLTFSNSNRKFPS